MLDEHAAHVLDYCSRLVGDDAEAASAMETAMSAAQTLLADPDRLRAWLFALARQEIVTGARPPGQDPDAEILDLVYRHGIRLEDLPAVLGVTPERAKAMLADAEALAEIPAEMDALAPLDEPAGIDELAEPGAPTEVDGLAAAAELAKVDGLAAAAELAKVDALAAGDGLAEVDGLAAADDLDGTAELLAEPLPAWILDSAVGAFFDDHDIDAGSMPVSVKALANPSPFGRARRRLGISAALAAAAGAAAAAIFYLGGSPSGQADTHGAGKPNIGSAAPAVSSPAAQPQGRSAPKGHHHLTKRASGSFPAPPVGGVVPVTSTSAASQPTHSQTPQPHRSPSSSPPTITPPTSTPPPTTPPPTTPPPTTPPPTTPPPTPTS
jgi:hypothetical protein